MVCYLSFICNHIFLHSQVGYSLGSLFELSDSCGSSAYFYLHWPSIWDEPFPSKKTLPFGRQNPTVIGQFSPCYRELPRELSQQLRLSLSFLTFSWTFPTVDLFQTLSLDFRIWSFLCKMNMGHPSTLVFQVSEITSSQLGWEAHICKNLKEEAGLTS